MLRRDDLLTGLTQSPLNPKSITLLHDTQALLDRIPMLMYNE